MAANHYHILPPLHRFTQLKWNMLTLCLIAKAGVLITQKRLRLSVLAFLRAKIQNLQRDMRILWRFSYGRLPGIPSHNFLQKVRGYTVSFKWLRRETRNRKILLPSLLVKGEIAFDEWGQTSPNGLKSAKRRI